MMNWRFSGQQRVGLVLGEVPVGRPVGLDQVEPEPLQQRPDDRAGHPVAAVDDDLQRPDRRRVDEARATVCVELRVEVDLLDRAFAGSSSRQAGLDQAADVLDAAVAGQRDRALAHELRAGVGLRVVRGGAHQPAVELARADEVVEHLGADLAGVEHVRALGQQPVAVARRTARGRSGACRARGRRAARGRACRRGRRARARTRGRSARRSGRRSARRRGRGCRRP